MKMVLLREAFSTVNNQLVYWGINVDKKYYRFVIEYYEDVTKDSLHYIGFYQNGLYDGIGIETDRCGSLKQTATAPYNSMVFGVTGNVYRNV